MKHRELPAEELTLYIDEDEIEQLQQDIELPDVIGQTRALRALQMGTEIMGRGYNIFVTGQPGTGRATAIRKILHQFSPSVDRLKDILFAFNFRDPDYPSVLYLPRGRGKEFRSDIHQFIENMKDLIRVKLDRETYRRERDRLISEVEQQENDRLHRFEQKVNEAGFQLTQFKDDQGESTDILPVYENAPVEFEKLQELLNRGGISQEYWNTARSRYFQFVDEMKHLFQDLKERQRELENELDKLKQTAITPGVEEEIRRLQDTYTDERVQRYLSDLQEDVLTHLYLFQGENATDSEGNPALVRYGVNLLVDNSSTQTVPIIFEHHPTPTNLFGTIETKLDLNGQSRTTFMMIKPGSLVRASGGFIVLNAHDLLRDEDLWDQLKRTLQTEHVEIQPSEHIVSFHYTMMKPDPIRIDTKVIIVGSENLYDYLYNQDNDFHKHFKISAEFDSVMPLSQDNLARYIGFIRMIQKDENLLPFDTSGAARVVRHGVYLSEERDRLSTRFSLIADLLRESSYWAVKMGKKRVDREAVQKALDERTYLAGLPEEKMIEMISKGEISIRFSGTAVGAINGLAVHDRGYYSFGLPTVVSARVAPGSEGIINIEREVGLSGEIHDKWVMIIEGYLRNKYASTFPLSMYASLCFEQSYSEIEGDSASAAEVYALLSAIGNIEIDQGIAVTGSMNQTGEIQPVGGISEKIEGFFKMCKVFGLNGSQGVIIPEKNTANVMLGQEISEAIRNQLFHIYPITSIDEGLEILSGDTAGIRSEKGVFPKDSLNARVERRLKEMANQVKNYSG